MGKLASGLIEVGTFGIVQDPLGIEAGERAATQAAGLQAAAAQSGIEEQRRQFNITQEQMAPFREAGVSALEQQQAMLGLAGPEAQAAAMAGLQESPGQRFIRERQQRALLRNQAAIGGLGGGNVRTALQEQAAGFASQDLQNHFARLGQLAGQGQTSTAQTGQFGAQTAQNIANLQQTAGQARASGILGANQAQAQATGQVMGLLGTGLGAYFGG